MPYTVKFFSFLALCLMAALPSRPNQQGAKTPAPQRHASAASRLGSGGT